MTRRREVNKGITGVSKEDVLDKTTCTEGIIDESD